MNYLYFKFLRCLYSQKSVDARGVPQIEGKWNVPPFWFGAFVLLLGCIGIVTPMLRLLMPLPKDDLADQLFRALKLLFALPLIGLGLWLLSSRRQMLRIRTTEKAAAQFGVDEAVFLANARERRILPRYTINGQDYYDPVDFGDVATLLRASDRPNTTPETLLRPAANNAETPPQQLLRAASEE